MPEVRRVAVPSLRTCRAKSATRAIVAELSRQGEEVQAQLLGVLADRGDPTALPAVVKAADAAPPAVRLAAPGALASWATPRSFPLLAQRAAERRTPASSRPPATA